VAAGAVNTDHRIGDLLRELAPQVLGVLVRRHGQFDACEDAVQEALIEPSQATHPQRRRASSYRRSRSAPSGSAWSCTCSTSSSTRDTPPAPGRACTGPT
jgi:DNA-directed RNA polymerase specialized sigma24 family protein